MFEIERKEREIREEELINILKVIYTKINQAICKCAYDRLNFLIIFLYFIFYILFYREKSEEMLVKLIEKVIDKIKVEI